VTPEVLAAVNAARREQRAVVLATRLPSGEQMLLPDAAAPAELAAAAQAALRDDRTGTVKLADGEWFLQAFNPPLRLVVVGAVHIAQALVPLAAQLGLAVVVVDPRRSFATPERFPDVTIRTEWPDEAMEALRPDARTGVVTLTHDPKLDDPALDRALRSEAFYIGALGSRRTHAARLARLRELGHDEAALARIRGPVGLNLEAVTAPEIALSILAEFVAVRRRSPLAARAVAKAA
jgi:xanthine dehydrogenase accessory factor